MRVIFVRLLYLFVYLKNFVYGHCFPLPPSYFLFCFCGYVENFVGGARRVAYIVKSFSLRGAST